MFDWFIKLIEKGVESLRSLILRQTDKRWFIVLVLLLAVVGICVMLAKLFAENLSGILTVAAAVAVAAFVLKKMGLR